MEEERYCIPLPDQGQSIDNQVEPSKLHINGDYNVRVRSRALRIRPSAKGMWMKSMSMLMMHVSYDSSSRMGRDWSDCPIPLSSCCNGTENNPSKRVSF